MPVGHARAGGTAGGLVVVVDTEARLNHHVAVVVPVLAVLICSKREHSLSTRGSRDHWREKGSGRGFYPRLRLSVTPRRGSAD